MEIDLTKSEKKLARELFDKGIEREFNAAILKVDSILQEHKNLGKENRGTYHEILSYMKKHYRQLQRTYDGLRGSDYLFTLLILLKNNVISFEELSGFRIEVREYLKRANEII